MTAALSIVEHAQAGLAEIIAAAFDRAVAQRERRFHAETERLVELLRCERERRLDRSRHEVARVMLAALGEDVPTLTETEDCTQQLLETLKVVERILVNDSIPGETCFGAEPTGEKGAEQQVERLSLEWDGLEPNTLADVPLKLHLQVLTAKACMLQEWVPTDGEHARLLDTIIRGITRVQRERKPGFVHGLKRSDKYDWPQLLRAAERDLAKFERDAELGLPELSPPRTPAAPKGASSERAGEPNAEFEALRCHLEQVGPLALVGGVRCPDKALYIRSILGIVPEWVATADGKRGDIRALAQRIRAGKVGAVVIFIGLLGHGQVDEIRAACSEGNTLLAQIDRPGQAQLEGAVRELVGKVAA